MSPMRTGYKLVPTKTRLEVTFSFFPPLDVLQSLVVQCECLSTEAPVLVFRPAIFDSDVAAFDETCFVEAAPECRQLRRVCLRGCHARSPMTGIAGCCARAASGHAAAAPPSSVMNWRRFMSNMELPRAMGDHRVGLSASRAAARLPTEVAISHPLGVAPCAKQQSVG